MTEQVDERDRFGIYRLCACRGACEGTGKVDTTSGRERCPDCRGEGRERQNVANCATEEACGVMICTLARDGEFEECTMGLLDRLPPCTTCGGSGEDMNWLEGVGVICQKCKGSGIKPTGTWLILPGWLPSPRNVSDAGRVLASGRRQNDA